eukprot:sb/3476184/
MSGHCYGKMKLKASSFYSVHQLLSPPIHLMALLPGVVRPSFDSHDHIDMSALSCESKLGLTTPGSRAMRPSFDSHDHIDMSALSCESKLGLTAPGSMCHEVNVMLKMRQMFCEGGGKGL